MLAALEKVRADLGPNAVIVSVRKVLAGPSWQVWRKHLVEVIAVQQDGARPSQTSKKAKEENNQSGAIKRKTPKPNLSGDAATSRASTDLTKEKRTKNSTIDIKSEPDSSLLSEFNEVIKRITPDDQDVTPKMELPDIQHYLEETVPMNQNSEKGNPSVENIDWKTILDAVQDGNEGRKRGQETELYFNLPRVLMSYYEFLKEKGVAELLLQRVCKTCEQTLNPRVLEDVKRVQNCLVHHLSVNLHEQIEVLDQSSNIMFFVGTSGVGKTNLCAKLAFYYSKKLAKKVLWVCADTLKIGSINESRVYTNSIGIPLHVVYTPEELMKDLEDSQGEFDLILVDTSAINPRDEKSIVELGAYLTMIPDRKVNIVLSALMKETDIQNTISVLGPFSPNGLVFSKLDETNNFSNLFNAAWACKLPILFYSYGNQVMDHLSLARTDMIVNALFEERFIG